VATLYVTLGRGRELEVTIRSGLRAPWNFERYNQGWAWRYGGVYVGFGYVPDTAWGDHNEGRPNGESNDDLDSFTSSDVQEVQRGEDVLDDSRSSSCGDCAIGACRTARIGYGD
jgi:hypothetical protein